MRKTRRVRPAYWIAGVALGAGTAHFATHAYTLLINAGDVTVNGPATFGASTPGSSGAPALTSERESLTITVVKQHSSGSQTDRTSGH